MMADPTRVSAIVLELEDGRFFSGWIPQGRGKADALCTCYSLAKAEHFAPEADATRLANAELRLRALGRSPRRLVARLELEPPGRPRTPPPAAAVA